MQETAPPPYIEQWLQKCLSKPHLKLSSTESIKLVPAREVWDCLFYENKKQRRVILTLFKCGSSDQVNTNLPPCETMQKCALAQQELRHFGIPTPTVLGFDAVDKCAALVTQKIYHGKFRPPKRQIAAQYLARLHRLSISNFSAKLQPLIQASDPKQKRTYFGLLERVEKLDRDRPTWRTKHVELADTVDTLTDTGVPETPNKTLVHGDYFSANLLSTEDGIRIIDWETFALGDPMWDLAFLIGADRDLPTEETDKTIHAYSEIAEITLSNLEWHRLCWDTNWRLREIIRSLR